MSELGRDLQADIELLSGLCHKVPVDNGQWLDARNALAHLMHHLSRAEARVAELELAVREALNWLAEYQERYHLADEPLIARQLREVLGGDSR